MAPKAKAKAKAKQGARAKAKGKAAARGQGAAAAMRRSLLARPAMRRPASAGAVSAGGGSNSAAPSVRIRGPPGSGAAAAGGGSGNAAQSGGGTPTGGNSGGVANILATALQGGSGANAGAAAGGNVGSTAPSAGVASTGAAQGAGGPSGAGLGGGPGAAPASAPQSPLVPAEDEKDKRIRELEAQLWAAQGSNQPGFTDVQAILAARATSVAEVYQSKRLKTSHGAWWHKEEEQQGLHVKSGESLLQVSQRAPGQLLLAGCKRMIGSMTGAAALGMTAPLEEDCLRPGISTYLTTVTVLIPGAKNKEALKNKRNHAELEALAAILDAALSGEAARCADVAMQRFKALEMLLDGASWDLAEGVELKNTQRGLTSDAEKEAAMRALAAKQRRLEKAGGSHSSWGGYP